MKITQQMVMKILELQKLGADDEKIADLLSLKASVPAILEQFEKEKAFITVEEIAERFEKEYGKADKANYYYLKVLRLLKKGEIEGVKESNVKGWKVKRTAVEQYIEESKMTKEDWKDEAKKYKKLYEELKASIEGQAEKPQEDVQEEKPSGVTEGLPEEEKSLKTDSGGAVVVSKAYDFLFEGKNNEYDEEYKDYIDDPTVLTKEEAKDLVSALTEKVDQVLEEIFKKKETIKWEVNGKYKNPMNLRGRKFDTKEEAIEAAVNMVLGDEW